MAINDVSLTAGMRSNLLSLQGTVDLLNRTQNRLSTGKKVNTAIDNPVSFFAAQALNSRASIIDGLKDAMGQAVQTVQAADKGIKAITAMIEQAKGIAQSAISADNTQNELTVTLASLDNNATVGLNVGASTVTLTVTTATGATYFAKGSNDTETAANMAAAINSQTYSGTYSYSATSEGAVLTVTKKTVETGRETDAVAANVAVSAGGTAAVVTASQSELESLQAQYNTLRTQLTELAEDSGYKGKNLLSDDDLVVKFEGVDLTVEGFDASATGLGITASAWATSLSSVIDSDLDLLDASLTTLRKEASKMSGNLSIISVRQEFSTNMINTLTEGADKLTLADTNEEGANMLMLQTRQSLSTTALSLSAQAAQSVLRLFG